VRFSYFHGYNIVAACFVMQGASIGALFAYGVLFTELEAEFGWSRATISGASSMAFLIMGALAIVAGKLNDHIGPKLLIVGSAVCFGLGYAMLSTLQAPWQLYLLYGVLVGIGLSTHDVVTLSTVARWFVRKRGMMSGITKVGTGCGQVVVPMIASALIAAYGWRISCLVIGLATMVILVVAGLTLRRDPREIGLRPDGDAPITGVAAAAGPVGMTLGAALRAGPFWILCMVELASFFCLFTVMVHIVPHAIDLGLEPVTAALVLSAIGGLSIAGRLAVGMVNDRIGGKRSLIVCFVVLACALAMLQVVDRAALLFVFAGVYGFAHGGLLTVISPTVAELFGTDSHGVLFGIVLFCGTLGGALGPWMAGALFDSSGSYSVAFLVLAGVALLGIALLLMLRPVRVGRSLRTAG
jgi:MFS family permease